MTQNSVYELEPIKLLMPKENVECQLMASKLLEIGFGAPVEIFNFQIQFNLNSRF